MAPQLKQSRYLKKLFYFVWALWAMIVWIGTLLLVFIPFLLIFTFGGKDASRPGHKLARLWAWLGLSLCGIIVRVHGREKLDKNETYIFVSNHRSQLDIPVCARSTSHYFKFLAKAELGKVPLLGFIIKGLYIFVNRGSTRDRVLSLQKMRAAVEKGISIWIFPEGTRNKTEEPLGPFQDGAFRLALDTQKPIAIAALIDTGKNLPSGEVFQFKPGVVNVHWLTTIPTASLTVADTAMLKEKVRVELERGIRERR